MAKTITQVFSAANDSVTVINDINTNGSASAYAGIDTTQEEINAIVQRNVDHLEKILSYAPKDEHDPTPNMTGSTRDKTKYTDAITTGKAYIASNS